MAVHKSAPKAANPISVNSESAATNTAAMCSVPPPFHSRIAARGGADLILQAAADRGQAVALRVGLLQLPEQDLGLSAAQIHREGEQARKRQPLVPPRRRRGEPLILRGRSSRLGHGLPIPRQPTC